MATYAESKFGDKFLDDIIDFIGTEFEPEAVFTDVRLAEWAEHNGFVKEK